MALPSGYTLASAAVVVAAGVWLAASASGADENAKARNDSTGPVLSVPSSAHPPSTGGHHGVKSKPHLRTHVVPKVLVDVFNNSVVTGLAGTEAAKLRGAGWNVAAADNWHGVIPANTVYYPLRLRHAADDLAAVLGVHRLRPAVAPMQFDRLTVIFTGR